MRKVWDSSNVNLRDFLPPEANLDAFIKDNVSINNEKSNWSVILCVTESCSRFRIFCGPVREHFSGQDKKNKGIL